MQVLIFVDLQENNFLEQVVALQRYIALTINGMITSLKRILFTRQFFFAKPIY